MIDDLLFRGEQSTVLRIGCSQGRAPDVPWLRFTGVWVTPDVDEDKLDTQNLVLAVGPRRFGLILGTSVRTVLVVVESSHGVLVACQERYYFFRSGDPGMLPPGSQLECPLSEAAISPDGSRLILVPEIGALLLDSQTGECIAEHSFEEPLDKMAETEDGVILWVANREVRVPYRPL